MGFGASVRAKRIAEGIGMNNFAERIGVSPAYWSRVEREEEHPPRDEDVERAAAILGVRLDDLFVEAGRLPPDMREDLKQVVQAYRKRRQPNRMRTMPAP
jgi:HTH-type transcriptional regulator, competence development regulator